MTAEDGVAVALVPQQNVHNLEGSFFKKIILESHQMQKSSAKEKDLYRFIIKRRISTNL